MAIVETKTKTRPNASVEFFRNASPAVAATQAALAPLKSAGKIVVEYTYPDTFANLHQTETMTIDSLETFGLMDTAKTIEFDKSFIDYYDTHEFEHYFVNADGVGDRYTLTGIPDPFYCTTVYNFPTENDAYIAIMARSLEIAYDHKGKLVDTIVTTNSITVVHQYNDATDFKINHYNDLLAYVPQLATKNATRTITYTSGTYTK